MENDLQICFFNFSILEIFFPTIGMSSLLGKYNGLIKPKGVELAFKSFHKNILSWNYFKTSLR